MSRVTRGAFFVLASPAEETSPDRLAPGDCRSAASISSRSGAGANPIIPFSTSLTAISRPERDPSIASPIRQRKAAGVGRTISKVQGPLGASETEVALCPVLEAGESIFEVAAPLDRCDSLSALEDNGHLSLRTRSPEQGGTAINRPF
jgi:hypothetical protein